MTLYQEEKKNIIKCSRLHNSDTGSVYLQLVLLSNKISLLQNHLKNFKKDIHSRYGLFKLISKRKKYTCYLKRVNKKLYSMIIDQFKYKH